MLFTIYEYLMQIEATMGEDNLFLSRVESLYITSAIPVAVIC